MYNSLLHSSLYVRVWLQRMLLSSGRRSRVGGPPPFKCRRARVLGSHCQETGAGKQAEGQGQGTPRRCMVDHFGNNCFIRAQQEPCLSCAEPCATFPVLLCSHASAVQSRCLASACCSAREIASCKAPATVLRGRSESTVFQPVVWGLGRFAQMGRAFRGFDAGDGAAVGCRGAGRASRVRVRLAVTPSHAMRHLALPSAAWLDGCLRRRSRRLEARPVHQHWARERVRVADA